LTTRRWSSASPGGAAGRAAGLSAPPPACSKKRSGKTCAAFLEDAALDSHVLQDGLARLDRTFPAFFRRVQAGEKAGFPRFQGRGRYHAFTYTE